MSRLLSGSGKRHQKSEGNAQLEADPSADHYKQIAEVAYFIAERRGFEQGHELEDWLCAEAEVNSRMKASAQ